MLEYFPLGVLALRAFCGTFARWSWPKLHLASLLWVVAVACADEIYQKFTPMRFASPFDAAADFLGASVGQFLWRVEKKFRGRA